MMPQAHTKAAENSQSTRGGGNVLSLSKEGFTGAVDCENGHPQSAWRHVPIIITNRQQDHIANDAWSAIALANETPGQFEFATGPLFSSASRLVFLDLNTFPPRIVPAEKAKIFAHTNQVVLWQKRNGSGLRTAQQPQWLAPVLLATPRPDLLNLKRISTTPFFDRDGRYVAAPGYHHESQTWLDLGELNIPATIATKVCPAVVKEAVSFWFDNVLVDFPFASTADSANFLAQFLVPLVRDMISGPVMGCMIEAPTPGSGKTLCGKLVGGMAAGGNANISPLDRKEAEIRKVLTSSLLAGEPVLMFDNITGYLDSGALAAVLSADVWRDRILGSTQMVSIPITTQLLFTGNNVRLSGELADRMLRVRLVPDTQHPRQRTGFKHDNIEQWLHQNRALAIWHLVVLVQNWLQQGSNYTGPIQGTYESYCFTIGGILEAAGVSGFLGNRNEFSAQAATSEGEYESLTGAWWDKYNSQAVTAAQLNEICDRDSLLVYVRGDSRQTSKLSRMIATSLRERVFNGKQVCTIQRGPGQANQFQLRPIIEPTEPTTTT